MRLRRRRTQLPVPRPLDNHPNGEMLRDDPDPPPVPDPEPEEAAVRALVETGQRVKAGRAVRGPGPKEAEARRLREGRS